MAAGSSSDLPVRVARVTHGTTAEGPGLRTAIWVQGCSIRCVGCINPHLFSPTGGTLVSPTDIVREAVRLEVEGITLLGGEPFDQAGPVGALAAEAQSHGLGVICFTGYTETQAAEMQGATRLLDNVDLLVDGPYLASQPESHRALVGSANQQFIHLTNRYLDYSPESALNRVDIRIGQSGDIDIAGFLTSSRVRDLADSLKARRVRKPRDRVYSLIDSDMQSDSEAK